MCSPRLSQHLRGSAVNLIYRRGVTIELETRDHWIRQGGPRHGTSVDPAGLPASVTGARDFGPRAASIEEFLDAARAQIAVELTTLNPSTGEPATAHMRAAIVRHMHVVTANKGP